METTTTMVESFKSFDVVSDESDHYYIFRENPRTNSVESSVYKKMMEEWRILEKGTPESIYVRVYETRIDMLRAMIVGAPGTPYHDGLFFFDIAVPSDYPNRPPLVYYHAHGLRLNPNLYANGLVCLSLLNTWHGDTKERWNPKSSTILQVLVSIQGLVLNEKPYLNEPGILRDTGGKSKAYNETAFILSLRTMIYTLRKPPKHYENLVRKHFSERGDVILAALKAYKSGEVEVGYYGYKEPSSSSSSSSSTSSCSSSSAIVMASTKFKRHSMTLVPLLNKAFLKASQPKILTENNDSETPAVPRESVSSEKGILRRFSDNFRKMFCCKKL